MDDRRQQPERREALRGDDRRRYRTRSIEQMKAESGPPLRIRDLAAITGFSKPKIMDEISNGHLTAYRVPAGSHQIWLIAFAEAKRYLKGMQLI